MRLLCVSLKQQCGHSQLSSPTGADRLFIVTMATAEPAPSFRAVRVFHQNLFIIITPCSALINDGTTLTSDTTAVINVVFHLALKYLKGFPLDVNH